jgi:hypothetical protein
MMGMQPGVMGSVVSVNGTTLTVSGHSGMGSATTTFTVDASAAKVIKVSSGKPASSTVSSIAVGDKVMVEGTVSGTSITATTVLDGLLGGMMHMNPGGPMRKTPPMQPQQEGTNGNK